MKKSQANRKLFGGSAMCLQRRAKFFNMGRMVRAEWGVLGFFYQRRAAFAASTAFQRVGGGYPQQFALWPPRLQ
jgi:hypothetical protein